MTKIGNYLYDNNKVSSGLHGKQQDNQAIDSYGSEKGKELWLKAGDSGHCERPFDIGTIYEGFHFITDSGVDKLVVHAKYPGNKHYNKVDFMTKSAWNHFHRSVLTKAGWKDIQSVSNPNEVTFTSEFDIVYPYDPAKNFDAITGLLINNTSMQIVDQLPNLLKLTATHTVDPFNIRLEANSKSQDIGDVPRDFIWFSNIVAYGEEISNGTIKSNKWYGITVQDGPNKGVLGYCSALWVKEEPVIIDCKPIQTELDLTKQKIEEFKVTVNTAIDKFKEL